MIDKIIVDLRKNFVYSEDGNLYRIKKFGKTCDPYIPYKKTNNSGYYSVRVNPTCKISLHVAIWAYHYGRLPSPKMQIDHIDRNKLNNKIENLRELSVSDQKQNVNVISTNTSGIRNICYHKSSKNWRITLMFRGKLITKYFKTKEEAEEAYGDMIKEYTNRNDIMYDKEESYA